MTTNKDRQKRPLSRKEKAEILSSIDALDLSRSLAGVLKSMIRGLDTTFRLSRDRLAAFLNYSVAQTHRHTNKLESLNLLTVVTRFRKPLPGQEHPVHDWNEYRINVGQIKKLASAARKKADRSAKEIRQNLQAEMDASLQEEAICEPSVSVGSHDDTQGVSKCDVKDPIRNLEEEHIPAEFEKEGNQDGNESEVIAEPITRQGLMDYVFRALKNMGAIQNAAEAQAADASLKDYLARSYALSYTRALDFVKTGLVFHHYSKVRVANMEASMLRQGRLARGLGEAKARRMKSLAAYEISKAKKLDMWAADNEAEVSAAYACV